MSPVHDCCRNTSSWWACLDAHDDGLRVVAALLLLAHCAHALRTPYVSQTHLRRVRSPPVMMPELELDNTCALIELSADEPKRVASVLRKAWMEGGVKRGLTGSVLVPEDGKVQIVCQGQLPRLKSFAEWLETESQLVSKVDFIAEDSCPVVPLSNKFPFADAENEAAQPWKELLQGAGIEMDNAKGVTQSNDEGLF